MKTKSKFKINTKTLKNCIFSRENQYQQEKYNSGKNVIQYFILCIQRSTRALVENPCFYPIGPHIAYINSSN